MKKRQPMQPIVLAPDGVVRFQQNAIVRHLLDEATAGRQCDMNILACRDFSVEDREQFAQLIGYSVSGFGDLSYARPATVRIADEIAAHIARRRGKP